MAVTPEDQRALFRRWPGGVSVVAAQANGHRGGMTVSSLISLSLEERLVAISIADSASLHAVLVDAPDWAVSILSGSQQLEARHFAQSLEPDELWAGMHLRGDDPRLLEGAAGWLVARTVKRIVTGDHTLFVGKVVWSELGPATDALVYVHRGYVTV